MIAAALALVAAFGYGVSTVLQHRAARDAPAADALRPRLLIGLLRRPLFLAGYAANVVAYLVELAALAGGALVLVQPLLVMSLVFGLALAAVLDREPLTRRGWSASGAIVAGLAAFVLAARPEEGRPDAPWAAWLVFAAVATALAVVGALAAPDEHGEERARRLAAAAASLMVVSAALTNAVAERAAGSLVDAASSWHLPALAVFLSVGLVVTQSAYQGGPLRSSMPVINGAVPTASIIAGALLFDESIRTDPPSLAIELIGIAAVLWGVVRITAPVIEAEAAPT